MKIFPRVSIRHEKARCLAPRVLDRDQRASMKVNLNLIYKKLVVGVGEEFRVVEGKKGIIQTKVSELYPEFLFKLVS